MAIMAILAIMARFHMCLMHDRASASKLALPLYSLFITFTLSLALPPCSIARPAGFAGRPAFNNNTVSKRAQARYLGQVSSVIMAIMAKLAIIAIMAIQAIMAIPAGIRTV